MIGFEWEKMEKKTLDINLPCLKQRLYNARISVEVSQIDNSLLQQVERNFYLILDI
jgi:hypothetical protein